MSYDFAKTQEELGKSLLQGDHLSAVLRTHIHLDAMLTDLILRANPRAKVLVNDRTSFSRKIDIAFVVNSIDEDTVKPLTAFNKVRNQFAHKLELRQLTTIDDSDLPKTLPKAAYGLFVHYMNTFDNGYNGVNEVGYKSRIFMLSLWHYVLNLLSEPLPQ